MNNDFYTEYLVSKTPTGGDTVKKLLIGLGTAILAAGAFWFIFFPISLFIIVGIFYGAYYLMTGVDADGKVTGVNILSHGETAGLGANATNESFRDQFKGLVNGITVSKDKAGENSIDALTGATITSRAVVRAVNAAIEAAGGESNG